MIDFTTKGKLAVALHSGITHSHSVHGVNERFFLAQNLCSCKKTLPYLVSDLRQCWHEHLSRVDTSPAMPAPARARY